MRLPDMQAMTVRETVSVDHPLSVSVGVSLPDAPLWREFPLVYMDRGTPRPVGVVRLEASLDDTWRKLREKVVVILVTQGIKTFLVSMFTLYIVYRLITRHLVAIAGHVARYVPQRDMPPLRLDRRAHPHHDEVDLVVNTFNDLAEKLDLAYQELHGVNAELERDIAERQARERELQEALDKLTEASAELERFAYVAAHDLQEPLRGMVSFAQLLNQRYQGRLDADADEYIAFIVAAGRRMHELVNGLDSFSRISSHGAALAPVSSQAALDIAIRKLDEAVTASGAAITLGDLPEIMGDQTQLSLLFQHLLGNAIKFRRPDAAPVIRVDARPVAEGWEFTVADNGVGVDAPGPQLFEIFRRHHGGKAVAGAGVGLAICKRIVGRHGGRIWMESRPGEGAEVHFVLPATLHAEPVLA
jgi:signal transduction histidine kinase